MTERKCDRCGKRFDEPADHNEYFIGRIRERGGDNIPVDELDICPGCHEMFLQWWQLGKAYWLKPSIFQQWHKVFLNWWKK